MLLEGAINALGKVGLMLNVHKDNLAAVLAVLPALKRPTISHLSDDEWLAVNTILDEIDRARHHSPAEAGGRRGHCGVSAEQDRAVIRITRKQRCGPPAGAQGGTLHRSRGRGAADSGSRAQARRPRADGIRAAVRRARAQERARAGTRTARGARGAERRNSARAVETAAANIRAYARAPDAARVERASPAPGCGWGRSCGRSIPWRPTFRRGAIRCPPR